ncbi:hypothetical protein SOVF_082350 [Spinacia oleracea]|nr:hypothetical protein SOVF_082350 [Spinacia oleracea]
MISSTKTDLKLDDIFEEKNDNKDEGKGKVEEREK